MPLLLLVDTTLAIARGWQLTEARGLIVFPLLAGLWVVFTFVLLIVPPYRRWIGRHSVKLFAASCGVMIGLLLGEWVIDTVAPRAPFHRRTPNAVYEFEPNSFAMPGVFDKATTTINTQGLRGDELPGRNVEAAYRILFVGGGTTECLYLDDSEAWPALVGEHLRANELPCDVAAAAVADYSSGHHLRFLQDSNVVRQTDCVVVMPGAGDLLRTVLQQPISGKRPPFWMRSALADLLQEIWNVRLEHGLVFDNTGEEISVMRWGRPIAEFDFDAALDQDLTAYKERIRGMIAAANEQGVRIVFIGQPSLWSEFLTPLGVSRLRWALDPTSPRDWEALQATNLQAALERYNRVTAEVCQQEGVEFIDTAAMNGREQYFYDDFHLNEAGCRRLAESVGNSLLESQPSPR